MTRGSRLALQHEPTAAKAARRRVHLRTCVGCGGRHPQAELVRLRRRSDGQVVVSIDRGDHGRSAYVCPTRGCFEQAARRRGLERSLRGPRGLTINTNATCRWPTVADELKRRIAETPSGSDRTAARALLEGLAASGKEVV